MNGARFVANKHFVKLSSPFHESAVEVVLVDAGSDLAAIAVVLRDAMAICISDPSVLAEAVPLVLYEELPIIKAEPLCRLIARAGGRAQVRPLREHYKGVKKSLRSRKKAA